MSQTEISDVIPVSGELIKAAYSFILDFMAVADPDDRGPGKVMVHLTLAPGKAGQRVLEAIKLFECTDPEHVREKCEGFENFVPKGKEFVSLLRHEPNRECWSDVIKALGRSKPRSVKNHAQKMRELLETQDRKRKGIIRTLKLLSQLRQTLPANFRSVQKSLQRIEELQESRGTDLRQVWNMLPPKANTSGGIPQDSIRVVLEECKPWLSPPAPINDRFANVPLWFFFGGRLAGVAHQMSKITNSHLTECQIERVELELAELWLKGIKRGNGLAGFELTDDAGPRLRERLHRAYNWFGQFLEMLIAAQNPGTGRQPSDREEEPRSSGKRAEPTASLATSRKTEKLHHDRNQDPVITVADLHKVNVDDQKIEHHEIRKVLLYMASRYKKGADLEVTMKDLFESIFPNLDSKQRRVKSYNLFKSIRKLGIEDEEHRQRRLSGNQIGIHKGVKTFKNLVFKLEISHDEILRHLRESSGGATPSLKSS